MRAAGTLKERPLLVRISPVMAAAPAAKAIRPAVRKQSPAAIFLRFVHFHKFHQCLGAVHGIPPGVAERIIAEIEGRTSEASFNGKGYCWLELGGGKAGFASGNFYAEPEPAVRLYPPLRPWHWGKVAFEKWWLRHWF